MYNRCPYSLPVRAVFASILAVALALAFLHGAHDAAYAGEEQGVAYMFETGQGFESTPACPLPIDGVSLPVLTVALGLADGFNPCAFFVLFFLMSLMVHARSKYRMALVGGVFVLISGAVYFMFMAAWLEVFRMVGVRVYITRMAGAVALVLAAVNIKDFFYFGRGPSLGIPEGAKPGLFARMRGLLDTASTATMLAGTVLLAVSANSYELLCTAGMPMVYTRVLTMNRVTGATYYAYLALYNAAYVLPLAVIVTVSSVTLGRRKLSERHGRILKLLSGNMMLAMGGALLISPAVMTSAASALLLLALSLTLTGIEAGLLLKREVHS